MWNPFSVFSFCPKSPNWLQDKDAGSQEVVSECHKNQQIISSSSGVIFFFFFLRTPWLVKGYVCMTAETGVTDPHKKKAVKPINWFNRDRMII